MNAALVLGQLNRTHVYSGLNRASGAIVPYNCGIKDVIIGLEHCLVGCGVSGCGEMYRGVHGVE